MSSASASPVQFIRPEAASAAGAGSAGIGIGEFPGRQFDMDGLRRVFRDRWAAFLKAHFRNSVEVAFFFGTDERTARQWLEGVNAPSGPFVARAVDKFPAALPILMGRAA